MKKRRKAFTLVELIIVIAIMGILAAIAIPKYNNSRIKAAETAHNSNIEMLKSAARLKILDKDEPFAWQKSGENSTKVEGVTISNDYDKYIERWPELPNGHDFGEVKEYTLIYDGNNISVTPGEIKN